MSTPGRGKAIDAPFKVSKQGKVAFPYKSVAPYLTIESPDSRHGLDLGGSWDDQILVTDQSNAWHFFLPSFWRASTEYPEARYSTVPRVAREYLSTLRYPNGHHPTHRLRGVGRQEAQSTTPALSRLA